MNPSIPSKTQKILNFKESLFRASIIVLTLNSIQLNRSVVKASKFNMEGKFSSSLRGYNARNLNFMKKQNDKKSTKIGKEKIRTNKNNVNKLGNPVRREPFANKNKFPSHKVQPSHSSAKTPDITNSISIALSPSLKPSMSPSLLPIIKHPTNQPSNVHYSSGSGAFSLSEKTGSSESPSTAPLPDINLEQPSNAVAPSSAPITNSYQATFSIPLAPFTIFIDTDTTTSNAANFNSLSFHNVTRTHLMSIFANNIPKKFLFSKIILDMETNTPNQRRQNVNSDVTFASDPKLVENQWSHVCNFESQVEFLDSAYTDTVLDIGNFDYLLAQAFQGEEEYEQFIQALTSEISLDVISIELMIDDDLDPPNTLVKDSNSTPLELNPLVKVFSIAFPCVILFSIVVYIFISKKRSREKCSNAEIWKYDLRKESILHQNDAFFCDQTKTGTTKEKSSRKDNCIFSMDLGLPYGHYNAESNSSESESNCYHPGYKIIAVKNEDGSKLHEMDQSDYLVPVKKETSPDPNLSLTLSNIPLSQEPSDAGDANFLDNFVDLFTNSMPKFACNNEIV